MKNALRACAACVIGIYMLMTYCGEPHMKNALRACAACVISIYMLMTWH